MMRFERLSASKGYRKGTLVFDVLVPKPDSKFGAVVCGIRAGGSYPARLMGPTVSANPSRKDPKGLPAFEYATDHAAEELTGAGEATTSTSAVTPDTAFRRWR